MTLLQKGVCKRALDAFGDKTSSSTSVRPRPPSDALSYQNGTSH